MVAGFGLFFQAFFALFLPGNPTNNTLPAPAV